jgi:hypothetical protein
MNKETLKAVITELFNLLEERFARRPLMLIVLHAIEAAALGAVDTLLANMNQKLSQDLSQKGDR